MMAEQCMHAAWFLSLRNFACTMCPGVLKCLKKRVIYVVEIEIVVQF